MKFYLGTHKESWLEYDMDIPLFISYRTLRRKKNFKKVRMTWALDSGGFSELSMFGKWTIDKHKYLEDCYIYCEKMGNVDFLCPQDWMCEPYILKSTGKTVEEHQHLTVQSYLDLSASGLPFMPILQGWKLEDYIRHIGMYLSYGVDLREFDVVGVWSVCRRQGTEEIGHVIKAICDNGIKIHGFGVKKNGLGLYKEHLRSSDSLAWSKHARHRAPLEGCTHMTCANCFKYAKLWYDEVVSMI